jgi:hypothetical protein
MSLSLLDLRALHTAWADIKLDQQRASWDSTALELANNEERFANSRKQLATLTKSFRASEPAQQLENIGSIVKAYQGIIFQSFLSVFFCGIFFQELMIHFSFLFMRSRGRSADATSQDHANAVHVALQAVV